MVARPLLALLVAGTILAGCGVDGGTAMGLERKSAIRACESANSYVRHWEVVAGGRTFESSSVHRLERTIEIASRNSQDTDLRSATRQLLLTAGPVLTDNALHATFQLYGACQRYGLHFHWDPVV